MNSKKTIKSALESMMYVWGHSYEFDNAKNWSVIEDFAAMMAGQEDIWLPTWAPSS